MLCYSRSGIFEVVVRDAKSVFRRTDYRKMYLRAPLKIGIRRLFASGQSPACKIFGGYLQVATLKSSCIGLFAHSLKIHPIDFFEIPLRMKSPMPALMEVFSGGRSVGGFMRRAGFSDHTMFCRLIVKQPGRPSGPASDSAGNLAPTACFFRLCVYCNVEESLKGTSENWYSAAFRVRTKSNW